MGKRQKPTVLITGGSSGIGFEMAKLMVQKGWDVFICGRTSGKLDKARAQIPELKTIRCDISDTSERLALLNDVSNQCYRLDMLMNNAGIVHRNTFEGNRRYLAKVEEEWQINYLAPVMLSRLFLPMLKRSGGAIVNVTSGLVYVPLAAQANYCATKAALHSMTVSLRHSLEPQGVKVQEIFYPAVDTPFQNGHAPAFAIQPGDAAAIALKGILRGKREVRVKKAALIHFLSRIAPQKAHRMLNKMVSDDSQMLSAASESNPPQ